MRWPRRPVVVSYEIMQPARISAAMTPVPVLRMPDVHALAGCKEWEPYDVGVMGELDVRDDGGVCLVVREAGRAAGTGVGWWRLLRGAASGPHSAQQKTHQAESDRRFRITRKWKNAGESAGRSARVYARLGWLVNIPVAEAGAQVSGGGERSTSGCYTTHRRGRRVTCRWMTQDGLFISARAMTA